MLTSLQCLNSDRRGSVPEPGPDLSKVALTQLLLEVECRALDLPLVPAGMNVQGNLIE